MLSFILLNDSEKPINAAEEGWTIVIDGKELEDSGYTFGNGPGPVGGWGTPENRISLERRCHSAGISQKNENIACFGRARGSKVPR